MIDTNNGIMIFLFVIIVYLLICNNDNSNENRKLKTNYNELKNTIKKMENFSNLSCIADNVDETGTITIPANVKIEGNIDVTGNSQVNGNLKVEAGNLEVKGNIKLKDEISIYRNNELTGSRIHIRNDNNKMKVNNTIIGNEIQGARIALSTDPRYCYWVSNKLSNYNYEAIRGIKFGVNGHSGSIFSGGMNGGNNGLTVVRNRAGGSYKVLNENNSVNGGIYNNY